MRGVGLCIEGLIAHNDMQTQTALYPGGVLRVRVFFSQRIRKKIRTDGAHILML